MNKPLKIESVIALNRFGLGARPNEPAQIDRDPQTWLLDQLQGPSRLPAAIGSLPGTASILVEVQAAREQRQEAKKKGDTDSADATKFGRTLRRHYQQQTGARYVSAATTDYPFQERLVHFWSNHFAVSADKQPIQALAGAFENEVVRPNISGKFKDLLLAAERHPAEGP